MSLPPFPDPSALMTSQGRISSPWSNWLNSVRAAILAGQTSTTAVGDQLTALAAIVAAQADTVTALMARVATLEAGMVDLPYDPTMFDAQAGMTWTVGVAAYQRGRVGYPGPAWMTLAVELFNSTVGGVAASYLALHLPNGRVCDGRSWGEFTYDDGSGDTTGMWYAFDGESFIRLYKDYNGTAWTLGSGVDLALTARLTVR